MSTIKSYKMKFPKSGKSFKCNVERYNSAAEVVDDCKKRSITSNSFKDKSTDSFDEDWEGVKTYDEALDLLKFGYQPTVDDLSGALKATKLGTGKRISFSNDIVGSAPVVPLVLTGVPNSMINMKMKPIKCKVLDVYYDISVSCGVSPKTIIENGQKILGAIIDLEKQGYRFNLYAMQGYCDNDDNEMDGDILCVKVKSADKPIDLKRISFPLTHPAFFRVIGFDWYSRMPIARYRSCYGTPLPRTLRKDEQIEVFTNEVLGDNAVYISGTKINDMDIEHIKEALKKNEK